MPLMSRFVLKNIALSLLSALLLSLPWRVPHTGWLLLIALLPLFWVEAEYSRQARRGCWKYYTLTFLVWNALTCYWVSKATLAGGIFAVVGNAFQMFLIFALFRWAKRRMGQGLGYFFLAVLWMAWEYFYFDAEISWPWLVLGNGFADTTSLIQWYEYTGVLGGSAWVFLANVALWKLWETWQAQRGSLPVAIGLPKRIMIAAVIVLLPVSLSLFRYFTFKEAHNPIEVAVLQPNIDPYIDKFGNMSQEQQDLKLLGLMEKALGPNTAYMFAPETFISTESVHENSLMQNRSLQRFYGFLQDRPQLGLVIGATSTLQYPAAPKPPTKTARKGHNYWYDRFNVAIQLSEGLEPQIYRKSKLVIGAEKMPYTRYLKYLNNFAVDLGGAMGSFGTQEEASVFPAPWNEAVKQPAAAGQAAAGAQKEPLSVGVAICYESVYGDYFASYVRKGAGLMSVITNDGWWGNTPGYHQHLSYSRLRAIETRRSIARSANTGISALINQRGDIVQQTAWWEDAYLRGELNVNHKLSFYVRHGDVIGCVCVYLLILLLIYSFVPRRYKFFTFHS